MAPSEVFVLLGHDPRQ